jgi:hypothetical protein
MKGVYAHWDTAVQYCLQNDQEERGRGEADRLLKDWRDVEDYKIVARVGRNDDGGSQTGNIASAP